MAASMTFTRGVNAGNAPISKDVTVTGGSRQQIDEEVPQNATTEIACVIDVSQMKGFYITVDKACSILINSSGSPAFTFVMLAGGVLQWALGDPIANPFGSTDVTKIFILAGAVGTVRVQGEILVDPTV